MRSKAPLLCIATAVLALAVKPEGGLEASALLTLGVPLAQQTKLREADETAVTHFGTSVAVSGDTVVIGAFGDSEIAPFAGAAYVFVRSGAAWNLQQKLTASDGEELDLFGNAVAISGDTILVGAYADDDLGFNTGSAYVFVRQGTTWTQQQKLTAGGGSQANLFGTSVAVDGETIVVGSFDDDRGLLSGSAYVYVRDGSIWAPQQKLTASDGSQDDFFG